MVPGQRVEGALRLREWLDHTAYAIHRVPQPPVGFKGAASGPFSRLNRTRQHE